MSVCFRTDLDNFAINPYQGFVDLKKQEKRFLICRQSVPACSVTFCDSLLLIGTDLKGSKTVKKMLENRPEDALGTLVKLVMLKNSSKLFKLYKISHTLKL